MIAATHARKSTEQTHTLTKNALACAMLLLFLTACRQGEVPKPQNAPVDTAAQQREAEFRQKQACFEIGTKFLREVAGKAGAEVTEVFCSPKRSSCICETTTAPDNQSFSALELSDRSVSVSIESMKRSSTNVQSIERPTSGNATS